MNKSSINRVKISFKKSLDLEYWQNDIIGKSSLAHYTFKQKNLI